jgi:AAA family ATP:ADP antiporter
VFFIWTSVFNLFVVSVFRAFMVDLGARQKRLFGFIGVGGTLGGIAGAALTAGLAERIGPASLFLVSALLLEGTVQCVRRLSDPARRQPTERPEQIIGGKTLAGIGHVLGSPYLLGICGYMLLFTIGSTVLYFQQAQIAERSFTDRAAQTAFFARLDLAVNILTALTQVFLTGRLIKGLGVRVTLSLLPLLSIVGFLSLGAVPVLAVFVVFQVMRAREYAVAGRRAEFYTVLPREDIKAKHFIGFFVYRAGDGALGMRMRALGRAWQAPRGRGAVRRSRLRSLLAGKRQRAYPPPPDRSPLGRGTSRACRCPPDDGAGWASNTPGAAGAGAFHGAGPGGPVTAPSCGRRHGRHRSQNIGGQ